MHKLWKLFVSSPVSSVQHGAKGLRVLSMVIFFLGQRVNLNIKLLFFFSHYQIV